MINKKVYLNFFSSVDDMIKVSNLTLYHKEKNSGDCMSFCYTSSDYLFGVAVLMWGCNNRFTK